MFLARHITKDANAYFIEMIDKYMPVFGEVVAEAVRSSCGGMLSDEQFAGSYVEGMHQVTGCIRDQIYQELKSEPEAFTRFLEAEREPGRLGFRFANDDLTIGKLYIYFVWGKTKRRASKSDCIRLEKRAFQLAGKTCLELGIVH